VSASGRRAAHDAIDAVISTWCASADASDLVELLCVAGVPAAVVVAPRDIAHNPQLQARGFFESIEHRVVGMQDYPTVPFRFEPGPPRWLRSAAPLLGEHTDALLTEIGMTALEIDALRNAGITGDRPVGV
jgi:crotonobetainyl-CoA:carnitine CoA-transferase CaiB-like acyl-CoA transferase